MKQAILALLFVFSTALSAQSFTTSDSQTITVQNDPPHSKLGFSISHLTISMVDGHFNDFNVELTFSKNDFSDGKFVVTAKTASVDTRVEARNNHLKSADFFDVEKYPDMKFESTSMVKNIGNQYDLAGNLTLHGVTKPVMLTAYYNGSVTDDKNNVTTHGFTVTGTIDRSAFGVGSGFPAAVVGNDVQLNANLEFPVKH